MGLGCFATRGLGWLFCGLGLRWDADSVTVGKFRAPDRFEEKGSTTFATSNETVTGGGESITTAPTGLTASGVAHDSVTISWAAPGQGSVTGYRILRGTDSNSLSAIVQNTDSTATEYTDSTVAAETTYHYAVLALSAEGDGAQSAAVSATTPAAPQQATVPDLRLSSTAAGQLTISWDTPQPTPSDYRIIWAAKR